MINRTLLRAVIAAIAVFPPAFATERPNILWITAEDMSPALGCYGENYAVTPHLDAFAAQSVRYSHAFATAPVCSPVRSCLITGCYAQSMGTHNMRSAMPLPQGVRGFPSYLRDVGYYTTNHVKTDYNTADADRLVSESWNDSSINAHWRRREQSQQPFFSVVNLMTTHQSRTMVWPYEKFQQEIQRRLTAEEVHDPATAPVPPYYPDTPIIRREWARFHDCVTAMDKEVGDILRQLKEDGLDNNTIVFFFSDHGSGMPRHKRTLLDTGMQVPLLIRFPEKWKHLAPTAAGETTDRLVSFVDFPATMLSLLEIKIPTYMQGEPFLGAKTIAEREFVFGHRDRVDEAMDCSRSIRSKRYLYVRNYMPHLSYNQPSAWPDQGEIRHEIYRLASRETMTDAQWHFAGPTKPLEELYDCRADPLNLNNLAGDATAGKLRQEMFTALLMHCRKIHDLGFIPEPLLPDALAAQDTNLLNQLASRFHDAAEAVGDVRHPPTNYLTVCGFWKAIGLRSLPHLLQQRVRTISRGIFRGGEDRVAKAEAAGAVLSVYPNDHESLSILHRNLESDDLNLVLHAARTIELLGKNASNAVPAVRQVGARCQSILPTTTTATFVQSPEQDLAMFVSFSANAFLKHHDFDKSISVNKVNE